MSVNQKRNLEQDVTIIKAHIGSTEKNLKHHSSVFMNIMGDTFMMRLVIGSSY